MSTEIYERLAEQKPRISFSEYNEKRAAGRTFAALGVVVTADEAWLETWGKQFPHIELGDWVMEESPVFDSREEMDAYNVVADEMRREALAALKGETAP